MRRAARRISWSVLLAFLFAAACGGTEPSPREGYLAGAEGAEIRYRVLGTGTDTVASFLRGAWPAGAEAAGR